MQKLGTIERRHGFIGVASSPSVFYPLEGSSGLASDFREAFGHVGEHDIGKQVFRAPYGLCMENEVQLRERVRKDAFRANPLLEGFLGTLLQDVQLNIGDGAYSRDIGDATPIPDDTDCGTIYDCPEPTFAAARSFCDLFYSDDLAGAAIAQSDCSAEQIGSDLYMEMVGHGVGFSDRDHADDKQESDDIAETLSSRRKALGLTYLETYPGDPIDGASKAWICGKEVI